MTPDKCDPRIEHTCVSVSAPAGLTKDLNCNNLDLDTAGALILDANYVELTNYLDSVASSIMLPPGVYTFTISGGVSGGATATTDTFTWTLTDPCLAPSTTLSP